jgi:predicted membrane protein
MSLAKLYLEPPYWALAGGFFGLLASCYMLLWAKHDYFAAFGGGTVAAFVGPVLAMLLPLLVTGNLVAFLFYLFVAPVFGIAAIGAFWALFGVLFLIAMIVKFTRRALK